MATSLDINAALLNNTYHSAGANPRGVGATIGNVALSNFYRPPQSGGATATTPVVTSKGAENDYQSKLDSFKALTETIAANKNLSDVQKDQLKGAQFQEGQIQKELDLKNKGLSIEQSKVDNEKANIDTKNKALGAITNPVQAPTPTPGAAPTPATPSPASGGNSVQTGIQSSVDALTSGLTDIQTAKDTLAGQTSNLLKRLMNGTIPLTPAQQTQINSLQDQLAQNEESQKLANKSYEGTVSESLFRSGGEYTPEMTAARIHGAVSEGVAKIQALDDAAAGTIAKLEEGFQKDNFDMVNKNYDILSKQLDDKASTLKTIFDTTTKALQDQRDADLRQQQFGLSMKQFDLSASNSAVDNKLKTAQIAKIYSDMATADITAAADWVKNIQSGAAKISDVPKNLKNAVAAGLANGNPQGVNAILGTTQNAVKELNDYVDNNHGFTGAVGAKGISQLFGLKGTPIAGTQAADFDAKLKQVMNDVVLPNLTILHGLGRVTDREFQALQSAVTSLSPNLSEGEFKTELKNITDMVNQKVADANSHNGISLPGNDNSGSGSYQGINLPN